MKSYGSLASRSKPPLNVRPRTNAPEALRSRGRNGETEEENNRRSSSQRYAAVDNASSASKTRERKASRANLIDAIKGMNEAQLQKISKIIKVRINKAGQEGEDDGYEGPSASVVADSEAQEMYDRVDELQAALAQD